MGGWARRLAALVVAGACAGVASTALAGTAGAPLAGTWTGAISGHPGYRITIVVDARETGGSWRISATCHGPLTLDGISSGYHHYRRRLAPGASCVRGIVGAVDCLKPAGANLDDAVTAAPNGGWGASATLRRVRR